MRETTSRIYKTACADGRGLALAGMYPVLNPSGYILAAHNKKGSIMKKRRTPADAAADIKRQAARAATRKIQGTESIGGGCTITNGCEIDLTQCAQTIKNTYAEKMAFFNALSGIQRTWTKQYIEGAILDYYYLGKRHNIRALCPVLIAVVDAIESGELKRDFSEAALLQWADGSGLILTAAGLAAWERLDSKKQANTRKATAARIGKRGPKPKYFLRRSCVKACCEKGLEQSGIEAALEGYKEECNFDARPIPGELQTITIDTIKHDLEWLRNKENVLPKLQGDIKAEFNAFKNWLKGWTP